MEVASTLHWTVGEESGTSVSTYAIGLGETILTLNDTVWYAAIMNAIVKDGDVRYFRLLLPWTT